MPSATTVGLVVDISRCQGRGGEPSPQSLLDNLLNPSVTSSAQTRATKEELGGRGGGLPRPHGLPCFNLHPTAATNAESGQGCMGSTRGSLVPHLEEKGGGLKGGGARLSPVNFRYCRHGRSSQPPHGG
jgi:hypothetical protein